MRQMMAMALTFALMAATLLAADRAQITLGIDRQAANVDSVAAAAREIEPRMGEITVINSRALVIGYMADSLADTTRWSDLRQAEGVELHWSMPDSTQ